MKFLKCGELIFILLVYYNIICIVAHQSNAFRTEFCRSNDGRIHIIILLNVQQNAAFTVFPTVHT